MFHHNELAITIELTPPTVDENDDSDQPPGSQKYIFAAEKMHLSQHQHYYDFLNNIFKTNFHQDKSYDSNVSFNNTTGRFINKLITTDT